MDLRGELIAQLLKAAARAAAIDCITNQPKDTRFELLWKSHFSHVQQLGAKSP